MSCAKRHVTAVIFKGSSLFVGTNECAVPQARCPRLEGEGYEKCQTVCHQRSHAEIAALRKAGPAARGGTLVLHGHDHCCDECREAMEREGIVKVVIV